MTMDFADAMRAALNLTRDHKLVEATRVIQSALSGEDSFPSRSRSEAAIHVIDVTAGVIEPETLSSG